MQAAVDLLRPTHSFAWFRGEDAYFVHNKLLKPIVEAAWDMRLPYDYFIIDSFSFLIYPAVIFAFVP